MENLPKNTAISKRAVCMLFGNRSFSVEKARGLHVHHIFRNEQNT